MNLFTLILASLLALPFGGGDGKKQPRPHEGEPGEERYYDYEREDVSNYRDRTRFQLPEPEVKLETVRPDRPAPESLAGYFPADTSTYYVDANPRLQTLIETHKNINARIQRVDGFRIQVYSGNSRSRALSVKSQLLAMGFNQKTYLEFAAPNFVVRLGDFMDKEEATLFFRRNIEGSYRGAFVVPDEVNVPKYDELIELEKRREQLEQQMENEAVEDGDFFDPDNNR